MKEKRVLSMKPVKALHEELIHSVDWAASNQVAWTRNNRKALLAALELAQQVEDSGSDCGHEQIPGWACFHCHRIFCDDCAVKHFSEEGEIAQIKMEWQNEINAANEKIKSRDLQLDRTEREYKNLEAENASLKAQLAEAEKLNETWSLAYERAQQQLADGGRRESFANQICVCGHMRRDHRAWFCNLCYSCHGFIM